MDEQELETRFTYHAPTEEQAVKYESIRNHGKLFAVALNALCPDSRELNIAFTHLDEVIYNANASIARRE